MIYYMIQGYYKEVDEEYHRHLYPCYLTSYNMTLGGDGFGLQSGMHDALKFESEEDAKPFMKKAIETFGDKHEFDIVPVDARILGRVQPKYVIVSKEG